MRRLALLAIFSLVAGLIFVPVAMAQEDEEMQQGEEVEEVQGQPEVLETPQEEAAEEPVEEQFPQIEAAESAPEEAVEEAAQQAVEQQQPVGEAVVEETVPTPQGGVAVQEAEAIVTVPAGATAPLPVSGGPGITGPAAILPAAAALLLGSGLLAYAVLRRRR